MNRGRILHMHASQCLLIFKRTPVTTNQMNDPRRGQPDGDEDGDKLGKSATTQYKGWNKSHSQNTYKLLAQNSSS